MAKIKYLDNDFKKEIIKLLESNNLNLLLGAGFSANILKPLGNMERLLEIVQKNTHDKKFIFLEALLYWRFFENSIYPMVSSINTENISNACHFLSIWKDILNIRDCVVLKKQLNIFTTNYDVVLEKAMEEECIEYNDGFQGIINPYFSTENYNKIYYKQVLFSDRISLLPIFNIYKIHGSITWKASERNDGKFVYGNYISELNDFYNDNKGILFDDLDVDRQKKVEILEKINDAKWEEIDKDFIEDILKEVCIEDNYVDEIYKVFITKYKEKFKIVNPTKEKFSDTLVNKNYYELLRIYCNELERENTLLIVYGFSFYDEHIEDLTKRALNNPSLILVIFSFCKKDRDTFREKFRSNDNVWIISLEEWDENENICKEGSELSEVAMECEEVEDIDKLDISKINLFLEQISKEKKENE